MTHLKSKNMRRIAKTGFVPALIILIFSACSDYLDIVPDNIPTVDHAFTLRSAAEKYLFTCYSYMPLDADVGDNPAILGGDEIWDLRDNAYAYTNLARGFQNVISPYGDRWNVIYRALRDCNIFLENVDKVPDLDYTEKMRWIAEVKVLKAYYHFYLIRMYGPIPLVRENLSIDSDPDLVKVYRAPVDECFDYLFSLIDEAKKDLPLQITNPEGELGRITQPIAYALKAKMAVMAASPLFNGNKDFASLKNNDGTALFNTEFQISKWSNAVTACEEAIQISDSAGFTLFHFEPTLSQSSLSDTIKTQLALRNLWCERWNSEIIWANTQSMVDALQTISHHYRLDPGYQGFSSSSARLAPPLKIAEMFYSENGVPINEDKTWEYSKRYQLRAAEPEERLYVRNGYTTARLNFNREPRYYSSLGFDGGIWYGEGRYNDKVDTELFYLQGKSGQLNGASASGGSVTGYLIKKYVHYQNYSSGASYIKNLYPWTIIRLTDLYLLYAEALNEVSGPSAEVYHYLNLIRERAGLRTVEESWTEFSTNPGKYTTQNGLREIIHQERLIEMAFEGQRFWDLRRWKKAAAELNKPILGWNISQASEASYYVPTIIWNQRFGIRDYFWPIRDSYIVQNRNLVQNLGW
jgi:hypothetical protein